MANLDFPGILSGPHELVAAASPQTITAAWADLAAELKTDGAAYIALYVNLDIQDSTNVRFRALAKHASEGTDEYIPQIYTEGASAILVEDEYFEFNVDADHKAPLVWNLKGVVPYTQFQVKAGVLGAPAGIVLSAYVTTALKG